MYGSREGKGGVILVNCGATNIRRTHGIYNVFIIHRGKVAGNHL